jgi:photosystem II stability/assembly factor-like uncharacterized protein
VALLFVGLCFAVPAIATAHSPHDEILAIQFSPRFALDLILFAIVRFNLLRSVDRGLTWVRSVRGIAGVPLVDLAVSPAFAVDQTVLAISTSGGIYRSADGGQSWRPASRQPERPPLSRVFLTAVASGPPVAHSIGRAGELWSSSDLGETWTPCPTDNLPVTCIASIGESLFAGTRTAHLLHSSDRGQSWQVVHRLPGKIALTDLAIQPHTDGSARLAAGTSGGGVAVMEWTAQTIRPLHQSLRREHVTSLAWASPATGSPLLFATTWRSGCHRSTDSGRSWTSCSAGLTTDPQADEDAFRVPHFSRVRASPDFAADETLALAGFDGLFVSTNSGQRWRERRCVLPLNLIVGMDAAVASPTSAAIAVSTYDAGPFLSLDSGRTWQSRASGLGEHRAFGIALSPDFARDASIFLATNWSLYRSHDAGATWQATSLGGQQPRGGAGMSALRAFRRASKLVADHLGATHHRTLRRLFHRARGRLGLRLPLPGFGAIVVASPTFSHDGTVYVAAGQRIWRSTDRGVSLAPVFVATDGTIGAVALSPNHVADHTVVITSDEQLLLSADDGATWKHLWSSPGPRISAVAFSPRFAEDHTLFTAAEGRLFRSSDSGLHWESSATIGLVEHTIIDAILPSANDAGEILVHAAGLGLFASSDAGASFCGPLAGSDGAEKVFSQLEGFPDRSPLVCLSPHFGEDRMIIGASQDRLCLSQDGGAHWHSMKLAARHSADRPEIVYQGKWISCDARSTTGSAGRRTRQPAASASLDFIGTGVRWFGETGPTHGIADVLIDGRVVAQVDQRAPHRNSPAPCYESPALPLAPHTIEIRRAPATSAHGTEGWLVLLALEVLEATRESAFR